MKFKKGMVVTRTAPWGGSEIRHLDSEDKVKTEEQLLQQGFTYKVHNS